MGGRFESVARLARQDGMSVLQAGEGADEVFCGYDNFRRFLRHRSPPLPFLARRSSAMSRRMQSSRP